jgi:uncharacterized protein (DUF885 family)
MRRRQISTLVITSSLLVGCSDAPPAEDAAVPTGRAPEFETLVDTATADFLRAQPKLSSVLDLPQELAGGPYAARLPDYSPEGFARLRTILRRHADRFDTIDRAELDEADRLDADIVGVILRYYAGSHAVEYGFIDDYFGHVPYVVNQLSGPIIDVPNVMTAQQRLASVQDVQDYVARLDAMGGMLDGIRRKMLADAEAGVAIPLEISQGALEFLDGFTTAMPADHILVTHLTARMREIDDMTSGEMMRFQAQATEAVAEVVYPGYRALSEALRGIADQVPEGDGIWAQPNGSAYYADMIRFMGDTDLSAPKIHEIGLAEVERITTEMDALLVSLGYVAGTVGERMVQLGADPQYLYEDTVEARAQLLLDLNSQVEGIMELMPEYFGSIPTQGVEVRRIPVHTEAGAPGGYYTSPSLDGTRAGIYWINLRDMARWPSFSLPTLSYHEAVPGHHFQIALNLAQEELPFLRRNAPFNAYIEGWALYSERVAWEMGLYAEDPANDLGRLQAELFRAVRLVVDTGLHHHRWSREQAIEYMASITGSHMSEVEPEIERYMAWPAQALGYKLGMLRILELRSAAEESLGSNFDIRAFHDTVLLQGAMPMAVLEQQVREWVAAEQNRQGA